MYMQAIKVASTVGMTRDEWLEARRKGIGGSDVGAILGYNKWSSPVKVYMDKIGEAPPETEQSEAAYWGTVLEDVVAQEFSKRMGREVRSENYMLQHPEYPWMLANLDRMIVGTDEILECKTADKWLAGEWKDDEIPVSYLLQGQHYMAVTGCSAVWFAVLIGGNDFRCKRVERDEEIIQVLIDRERDFWLNHVEKRIPPELDGSPATTELLKRLFPTATGDEVALPSEAERLILRRDELADMIKPLQEEKDACENRLKGLIGEHRRGTVGSWVVDLPNFTRTTVDTKALKKDRPEIYEAYARVTPYRKLSIKQEA